MVSLFGRYVAWKIVIPYLLLAGAMLAVAAALAANLVFGSLEYRFTEELVDAGRSANEAMVNLEQRHLTVLRSLSFTVGVDQALASQEVTTLQVLLGSVAVSAGMPYVDVFAPDGQELLALRLRELGPEAGQHVDPGAASWPPVRRTLARDRDALGEKFADVVDTPWGPMFVTAAPVYRDTELLGVIAVGQPLSAVVATLSSEAGSKPVTLYSREGQILASTIRAQPATLASVLAIPADLRGAFAQRDHVTVRKVTIDQRPYVEALGWLAIRQQPALLVGVGDVVSIIDKANDDTRLQMGLLFLLGVVLAIAIGWTVARLITRPVYTLVGAAERIDRDELDFRVPVETQDEIGILSATMNGTLEGLKERKRSREALERYISPQVYRLIQEERLEQRQGGETREITVLKTDIRDFTSLSESMDAEHLVEFLNLYFDFIVHAIIRYNGEIDKYMGDGLLAKFGATIPDPAHARNAVLCMVDILDACEDFNQAAIRRGWPQVRTGVGANTGIAVVGNIGASMRLEYTVISDAVNTAQRIEELCKVLGWDLLISHDTYEQARDVVEVGPPWKIQLRGQTRVTLVYPILGRTGAVSPTRRRALYELLVRQERDPRFTDPTATQELSPVSL